MNDEKFDDLLRQALSWDAERAMTRQSPQRLAFRRLAVKLASSTVEARTITVAPKAKRLSPYALPQRFASLATIAAAIVVAVLVGVYALAPGGGFGGPTGPAFESQRHGYRVHLPDDTWTVTEEPGEWPVGVFLGDATTGVDYFETTNLPARALVYVWLSSQPIPEGMSFDGWLYLQDGITAKYASCFALQGTYEYVAIAGETARLGTYRCASFNASGVPWSVVQVLFAHEDRGYAAYFWPEQEPEAPPLDELRRAALRWLSSFEFTDTSSSR